MTYINNQGIALNPNMQNIKFFSCSSKRNQTRIKIQRARKTQKQNWPNLTTKLINMYLTQKKKTLRANGIWRNTQERAEIAYSLRRGRRCPWGRKGLFTEIVQTLNFWRILPLHMEVPLELKLQPCYWKWFVLQK